MLLSNVSYGSGRPIIILHGLLGSGRNWASIAKKISAQGWQAITIDLRNHGESPHSDQMAYPLLAQDIEEVISSLNLEKPIVLGHSMGGKVAMALALTKPRSVGGLIIVDIAPRQYVKSNEYFIEEMLALNLKVVKNRSHADKLLAERVKDSVFRSFLLQNLYASDQGYQWRPNLRGILENMPALMGFPFDPHQALYRGPVLCITGDKSEYFENADKILFREFFPRASNVTIKGASHWVHADRPEIFFLSVLNFLTGSN
ncbi:MAG: alpha/beta fold hydrolase [Pseudomonadota bacterium]|nr:alpha/beta fold hydrolase [Pseudomonadota bacterium]